MSKYNCPNCGAPKDARELKCPYCGTSTLDFTDINFDDNEPVFLRVKMGNMIMTQKVIPRVRNISVNRDYMDITDCRGNIVHSIVRNMTSTLDVSFDGIATNNDHLYDIYLDNSIT